MMGTTPSVHTDTQPTRRVLTLTATASTLAPSPAVVAPQDTEWPGTDPGKPTHKEHPPPHWPQRHTQVPGAGSTPGTGPKLTNAPEHPAPGNCHRPR